MVLALQILYPSQSSEKKKKKSCLWRQNGGGGPRNQQRSCKFGGQHPDSHYILGNVSTEKW